MTDPHALFADLCYRLGVQPDRTGEAHVQCPFPNCGKEAVKGQTHFSFSVRGGHCFVCGQSASLARLARMWGAETTYVRPVPKPTPKPNNSQKRNFAEMLRCFEAHPDRVAVWQTYKAIPADLIEAYRLGVGSFPRYSSKCQHARLMVPLIAQGQVVGFRGRCINCDCGKWLSPSGSQMILFNGERLGNGETLGMTHGTRPTKGRVMFIVENPLDCIMLENYDPDVVAVATLGVSMWKDEWTPFALRAGFRKVVVWFDNDVAGNGGNAKARAEWLKTHPKLIDPNGIRLVNRLRAAGVPAKPFKWEEDAPVHADCGDVLAGKVV